MMCLQRVLLAGLFGFAATAAEAGMVTYSDSISQTTTNWSNVLTVSKFDTSLGTLNSVTITFGGSVVSNAKVESLDATSSTITAKSSAELKLSYSDGTLLFDETPTNSKTFNASAFDGMIDFGGTSGHSFGNVTATISPNDMTVLTSGAEFAAFQGTGTYSFSTSTNDHSSTTGAGNLISQISTTAGDSVSVTYDYTPTSSVPEPSTAVTAAIGVVVCGLVHRLRRRARA